MRPIVLGATAAAAVDLGRWSVYADSLDRGVRLIDGVRSAAIKMPCSAVHVHRLSVRTSGNGRGYGAAQVAKVHL